MTCVEGAYEETGAPSANDSGVAKYVAAEDEVLSETDIDYGAMLYQKLQSKNLLFIWTSIKEKWQNDDSHENGGYCSSSTLVELLDWTRSDILELIAELKTDETVKVKVNVTQKNQFANTVIQVAKVRSPSPAPPVLATPGASHGGAGASATPRSQMQPQQLQMQSSQIVVLGPEEEKSIEIIEESKKIISDACATVAKDVLIADTNRAHSIETLNAICVLMKQLLDEKQKQTEIVINNLYDGEIANLQAKEETVKMAHKTIEKCYAEYTSCLIDATLIKKERKVKLSTIRDNAQQETERIRELLRKEKHGMSISSDFNEAQFKHMMNEHISLNISGIIDNEVQVPIRVPKIMSLSAKNATHSCITLVCEMEQSPKEMIERLCHRLSIDSPPMLFEYRCKELYTEAEAKQQNSNGNDGDSNENVIVVQTAYENIAVDIDSKTSKLTGTEEEEESNSNHNNNNCNNTHEDGDAGEMKNDEMKNDDSNSKSKSIGGWTDWQAIKAIDVPLISEDNTDNDADTVAEMAADDDYFVVDMKPQNEISFEISALSAGTNYEIQLRYRFANENEYHLKIWNNTQTYSESIQCMTRYVAKWCSNVQYRARCSLSENQSKVLSLDKHASVRAVYGVTKGMLAKIKFVVHCADGGNFFGVVSDKNKDFRTFKTAYNNGGLLDAYGIDDRSNRIYLGSEHRYVKSKWAKPAIPSKKDTTFTMVVDFQTYAQSECAYAVLWFYLNDALIGSAENVAKGYTMKLPSDVQCWYPACSLYSANFWCKISA